MLLLSKLQYTHEHERLQFTSLPLMLLCVVQLYSVVLSIFTNKGTSLLVSCSTHVFLTVLSWVIPASSACFIPVNV